MLQLRIGVSFKLELESEINRDSGKIKDTVIKYASVNYNFWKILKNLERVRFL